MDVLEFDPEEMKKVKEFTFEPREAYPRTLKQWWVVLLCKAGVRKPDCRYSGCCPVCGEFGDDSYPSSTMLKIENWRYDYWLSYEFGGNQSSWDETHQCEECGTVYEFDNASC